MEKRKKVGLVFGGGGARGLAHIGVLKVLLENNIPIDYIAGTSIGAWVAAHYALHHDLEKLTEITVGKKREKLAVLLNIKGGVVSEKKVKKLLYEWLGDNDFSETKIPLAVVAADLVSGKRVVLKQGKVPEAVYASMAVPGIFTPIYLAGQILVDGGVVDPLPSRLAREMGADLVIAVNLTKHYPPKDSQKKISLFENINISFRLMSRRLAEYSFADADIVIEPKIICKDFLGIKKYFFDQAGPEIMASGEEAARESLLAIKKILE
ncbi:MAG: patatin-like phospholipase family protein [Patescibacteria group bacterium]